MELDRGLLADKLAMLERARPWSAGLIARLAGQLAAPDEGAVLRMNPLALAPAWGIAASEALDLFLHAAKLGLVTMDWHLLCPSCGAAVESFASLRTVHRGLFCALCTLQVDANLDDYIQVSFTVAPGVRRLRFHDPDALSAEEFLYGLRFTREMRFGALDGPRMLDLMPAYIHTLTWVAPGERRAFTFTAPGPGAFAAAEFHAHTGVMCEVRAEAAPGELELTIEERTMTASREAVPPGPVTGHITNHRSRPVVFAIAYHAAEELSAGMPPTMLEPIVTGAMLLTTQTFRRLFRGETLGGNEGIGVRDVTVLFTDLKSSTALYERIGDLKAFSLVQRHFDRLGAVVQDHAGAIVKTIGDAVMAAFTRPVDAVSAALEMQAQIEAFNREQGGRDVVLKIGVHRGPSIAVTLNDSLDYFGHTVNVAARVQGLADADELFVTDDVYRADGVAALLTGVESRAAQLRGVELPVQVHKVTHHR